MKCVFRGFCFWSFVEFGKKWKSYILEVVIRSLPPLAKKYVLQMLYINVPVPATMMEEWVLADGASKHRVAIDRLIQLRIFSEIIDRYAILTLDVLNWVINPLSFILYLLNSLCVDCLWLMWQDESSDSFSHNILSSSSYSCRKKETSYSLNPTFQNNLQKHIISG